MLEITANSSRINEGTDFYDPHYLVWTLNLSEASAEAVTVEYRFLNGTALYGVDTYTGSGTLTFAAGETTREIYLRIDGDSGVELDESIVLELSDPSGAAFAGQAPVLRATSWILDDDGADEPRALFVSNPVVFEGDTGSREAVFELSLSRPAAADFEVTFATADGTALAGEDYQATTGTLTFAAGQTQASVSVPVFGDTDIEPSEGFTLTVTAPEAVAAVSAGQAQILADDAGTPTLSVIGSFSPEGTDFYDPHYLVWTLNLSEASAEAVTVEYRFLNGTALYGVDTYTGSGTLTFAAGETTREIYLRIDGDSGVELDESIVLELSDPSGAAFAGQAPVLRATSWILDDDGADEPRALFVSNPVVFEGDTGSREAVFELSLSRPAAADFEVTFATADGTALAGEDYQATTGTLTFAAGQTQASVSVPVFGDTDIEPSEGFTLTVTAPEAVAAVSAGQAQILADDAGTPTLSVIGSFSPEGTDFYDPHYLVWTLNLSEASAEAVTVEYRFLNGTALYGVDTYTGSGTLTFAAGETTREIYLRIDGDSGVELDESIVLELSDPSGAAFAGQAPVLRATSWILDDDGADEPRALFVSNPVVFEGDTGSREAVFELSLSRPAAADFEVTFATADGTALAGEDYQATTGTLTFAAGQTQASVSVPVFGDTDIEPSEGFTLTVTAPEAVAAVSAGQAQILADDAGTPTLSVIGSFSPEGTDFYDPHYLVWTLNLSEASAEAVTVEYRFLNGTALYGVDTYTGSGTLTFAAGETTREIYLRIDGDSGVELDESIVLELSDPSGAAFAGQAPVLRATSWILDDDGADEPRALFVSNPVVFEGDTGSREAVFELSLSRPAAADFEVTFATADGTALAGEDYQATTGTLTFAAGQTQASVSVPVFGDTDIEPSEGFTLTVTASEAVAAVSAGQAQILADDAGTPTLSVIGSFSPEGTDFYDPHYLVWTLNLSEASAEAVTVEYRFLNGTALYGVDTYTGSGTLTFAAGETTREIYLRIDGDSGVELDESIVLELSDPSGAAFAGQAPVLRATSWILDDDGADEPRALFVSNPVVFEGDTGSREAVFELSLSRPAAADFEVTFATADGTALAGEDYQATTGTLTFAAGQTQASVSVPVFGDTDIEPSEGFTLTVTAPEAVAAVSGGTGEIASDDSFPPVVEDDVATVRADQILSGFNVLANDSDPEGGGLTLVSVEADRPLGTLTFLADGTITYDPGAAFADLVEGRAESENFSYVVRDDLGVTTTGSLRIDVTGAQPFELSLDMPDSLEQGIAGQATLQFNNDAPVLLAVTLERGVVADPFSGAFETTIFVLGDGSGGLATHHLNIKGSAGPNTSVRGEVALANAAAVSDFVARFQVSQPDFLPQEAQDRVADVLAGQFGATIGDVAQALLPYDKALTSFGLGGGSAATALAFAVEEAGDFGSIAERGLQGGMGQGWSSLADLGLQMEDGFVQLTGLGDPAVLAALSADLSAIYALSQSVGRTMLLSGTLLERDAGPRPAFQLGEDGVFRPANGFSGSLSQTETGFELRYPDGSLLSFDAAGQFLQMLGQDGSLTTANYDDNGRISALNGDNGAQLDFVYDESGRLTQVDDGTGASSEFTYDAEGRLIAATTADGSSAFGYEPLHGDLITANPAAGPNAVMSYDDQGRLTSVDLGAGLIGETIAYAPGGQITITDGAGRAVEVQLLPSGEVGRVDLGEGQAAGLDFNSTGQVIALQATDGTETTLSYDADGRVVGVTDANGAVLQFGYEGDETRPSSFTDAGGSTRSFIYDAEGRIAEAVWPDGSSLSFVYDAQGDLTGFENRRGDNTSYEYDAAGRLTFESDGSAGATSYGYDTEGRLTSTSNDHGTTTLAYNDAGQITTVGYPSGKTLNYTYNDSGLRSGLSDGNGYEVFYEYDSVGRLSGLRDGNGSIVNYGYDGSGSLLFEVNGNGTSTNYAYDALGRLEQIENRAPDDSLSSFHNYSYDNANQRTSDQSEDGTWTYGYDATGQLTSAQFASAVSGLADKSLSFEYDGAGNRTRTIEDGVETLYTVNALNQYTQVGGTSFAYDADGNMTSRSDGAGTTTYAYDIQNRLTEVRGADGTVLQFTYDVFGNRLSKVENGLTTEYLVDPFGLGNVIGEYQGGTLSGQFWHGHGLARTEVGGTLAYVDSNAVGSVTALTDATGAALNDYLYTPFGRSLLEIETLANDREFNGALGVLEDAPGLITMRARSYDAELGRFISEDPLWLTGDTENLYRFAYNNPAGFIDPAGEVPILLPVALAGAVWIGKALGVAEKAQRIQEAIQTGNPHIVENELREIVDEIGTGLYDPKNFIPPLGKLFKKLPENMQDNLSEAIKQLIGYAEPGVREAVENHREQAALNDLFDDPMQRYAPDLDNDGRPDNLEPGESYIPPVDPADPWDEDSTNTDPADASARNDGDPHLTTFDGTGYSFQAVGEFTMAIGDGFEMQTRTEAINSRVSVNTATAMTIGDHVVGIYAREVVPLVVNGTSVVLERGETLAVGEGTVYRGFFGGGGQLGNFDVYVVTDGAGNGFWVNVYYGANHLRPFVADDQNVRGLLGNLNGDRTDDFQLRDGTVLDQPLPQTVLYGAYADSWRITQEDSLFLYDEGQDTSSFSDLNFPIQITRIGDLDPTERAVAEQIARDAGLVQGSFEFETTVIDIVMTGDAVFAQLVADAPDFEEDFDPGGVTPVEINLAPIPGSDVALVAERGTVLIDVLPNDSDPEGDALLLLGGSIDAGGTVVVEDGQLHAAPNVNFAGQTTLRYELGDDQGNVVEGIVVLTVDAIATRLNGTVAAETLVGGVANNEIYANGGDDRLIGNWGDDTLDGGTGIDTAVFDGPQSAFTLTLSPDRVTITDRQSVGQDTDTLISIEFLDFDQNIDLFGDNPMDLDIFSGPAGLSAAEFGAIIELYIAYFNRAPDALGLLYWGTRYAEGHPLSEMANDFFNQDETKATYASVLDASFQLDTTDPVKVGAFVNEVYSNVLGRTPDQPGYNYWTGELTNNEDITPANFILSIIGGAKFPSNPTPQTDIDQAYLATKSDLGAYFSVIKGMSDLDDAAQSMALFDGSLASRDATLAAMDAHYADALDPETGDFLMQLVGVIDDPFEVV